MPDTEFTERFPEFKTWGEAFTRTESRRLPDRVADLVAAAVEAQRGTDDVLWDVVLAPMAGGPVPVFTAVVVLWMPAGLQEGALSNHEPVTDPYGLDAEAVDVMIGQMLQVLREGRARLAAGASLHEQPPAPALPGRTASGLIVPGS